VGAGRPRFYAATIRLNAHDVPADLFTPDLDFMIDAGLGVARSTIAGIISADFDATNDWRLYECPFVFEPADAKQYLVQAWMLGRWHDEFKKIQEPANAKP